jgi:mannose-6-phosphate isomerase-like protein (cupin superfamily)
MLDLLMPITAAIAAQAQAPAPAAYVEAELRRLAEDYARDPQLIDVTFGVEVDGNAWTVDATPGANGAPPQVTVTRGAPTVASWVDVMDGAVFRRIIDGRISILTASARANSAERVLVNPRLVNGFSFRQQAASNAYRSVLAHFWATGVPEVIPWGFEGSVVAHGAQTSILHYAQGFRSGWWGIRPGQHVNADPSDQANPFPTLFIVMRGGTAMARLGGREMPLRDRTAIVIPAGMSHEFWNPGDEPAEGFLIMYGTGA